MSIKSDISRKCCNVRCSLTTETKMNKQSCHSKCHCLSVIPRQAHCCHLNLNAPQQAHVLSTLRLSLESYFEVHGAFGRWIWLAEVGHRNRPLFFPWFQPDLPTFRYTKKTMCEPCRASGLCLWQWTTVLWKGKPKLSSPPHAVSVRYLFGLKWHKSS